MKSRFKRMHPLVIFFYYVGAITLMIMMMHPLFLCAALLVLLAINFEEDHFKDLSKWIFFMIMTGFIIVILNPLFNHRGVHVLFYFYQHRITLEALVYGGLNALLIICILALFVSYNAVMTPDKLLYLFAKFLPQTAILLMLTLRFIPLMKRRLGEISAIQGSRGISIVHGRWKDKVKTAMLYVQILLVDSLEEAIQTADSMNARGYGKRNRSAYDFFTFKKRDLLALIYLLLLLSLDVCGRIYGYGFLAIYPVMEKWQLSSKESVFLVAYILFISYPLLIEKGEAIRWRLFN